MALSLSFLGDRITEDVIERWLYAQDMASVPHLLVRPFFQTLPDAIARPRTTEEIAQVVREAARERLPVTPRAAATTSYFQTVPTRGGLVLDLNELQGLVALEEADGTATVLPATRWADLDDKLRERGFATCSYPSSAVAATVGGWVSTGGCGIGSLRYGPVTGQVIRAIAVLPDGQAHVLTPESDPPLGWFAGAEGTLGILTEITLRVRPRPPVEAQHLLACDTPDRLQTTLLALARVEPRPYTLLFTDESYAAMLVAAGFSSPADRALLLVSFQGTAAEVERGRAHLAALDARDTSAGSVQALGEAAALHEWRERVYHLRVKRAGPSLLAAELLLPLERLADYLGAVARLAQQTRTSIGTYGVVVSAREALVTSVYPADARQPTPYLLALGLTKRLQDLGSQRGGRPYGIGLWNTPYLPRIFSGKRLAELRARKRRLDPFNLLNPGKFYQAPFPLWPWVFGPAANALATAYAFTAHLPGSSKLPGRSGGPRR